MISLYFLLSFLFGSYIYEFQINIENIAYNNFLNEYIDMPYKYTSIILLLSTVTFFNLGSMLFVKLKINFHNFENNFIKSNLFMNLPFLLFIFVFFDFRPNIPGATGNFANFFFMYLAFNIFLVFLYENRNLFLFNNIMAIILSFISFGDRRDVLYFYLVVTVFSLLFNNYSKNRFRLLTFTITPIFFSIFLIIIMSNFRIYYNNPSYYDYSVLNYLISSDFSFLNLNFDLLYLIENIDIIYFYFHGMNAVSSILNDGSLIAYGETIIKPLFVFFPRELLGDLKPSSMLTLYTTYYNPIYRSFGNSYPVNFFSELIWNFYIFAPFLAIIFGYATKLLNQFTFYYLINNEFYKASILITSWFLVFNVIRGAGLEYYLYGLIFIIIASLIGKYSTLKNYLLHIKKK